ncbi:13801_t:CDS:1, partial [Funneliformis geosporum]
PEEQRRFTITITIITSPNEPRNPTNTAPTKGKNRRINGTQAHGANGGENAGAPQRVVGANERPVLDLPGL